MLNFKFEHRNIIPKENRIEIMIDFRGNYYITKIYEDENPNTSNYELFKTEYENFDSQEIIIGLPDDLIPGEKYELQFTVLVNWDYEQTECDVEVHYVKNTLRKL